MSKPTIQDIFLRFYPRYLDKYTPSPQQSKVANCIINCKTGAYGANVSMCEDCGHLQIHYNSCRNRCCPMCQAVPKEMWMDARREDVLDAPYFHLVFTVPDILNPVIYSNQKLLYDALYHAASATISELAADSKYLGAKVGHICILHTWGSEMNFHPHIHVILLGGGLTAQNQWRDKGEEFFLPVRVMSKLFRGKYLDILKTLWNENKLQFHGRSEQYRNRYAFKELLNICYDKDWVPHCKKTFNGAQSVINYLGKYTHRIAISNHRIIRMDEDTVTFYVGESALFEKSRLENADKRGGTQQWDICLKKGGRYLLSFNYDSEIFLGAVVTANTDSLGKTYFLKGNDAYSNKEVEFSDSGNYTITLTSIFTGGLPSVRSLRLFPLEGQPLPVEGDATRIKEQYDNAEEQLSIYTLSGQYVGTSTKSQLGISMGEKTSAIVVLPYRVGGTPHIVRKQR